MRGKFITIEGCDGCGKTTQIELLKKSLISSGVDFVFTREPGGTEISERIRQIIIDPKYADMDMYTELLLYEAARRQHVAYIQTLLQNGKLVVCDRFTLSTLAYQGYGRGIDLNTIELCNKIALGSLEIDLNLFLDLPPDEAFLRKGGADKNDRLECEKSEFYDKVYRGYKILAKSGKVETIDAHGSPNEVHDRIMSALKKRGIL